MPLLAPARQGMLSRTINYDWFLERSQQSLAQVHDEKLSSIVQFLSNVAFDYLVPMRLRVRHL